MRDASADVLSPNGFGRNLRSKTRWFPGFCNSHQVSHFATFYIDARAEISVAESRLCLQSKDASPHARERARGGADFKIPWRFRAGFVGRQNEARLRAPLGTGGGARRARAALSV
ncbi:hypothetical protein R3W88_004146 [Solanum pinnatisectum]|uniref:Uncharacterized protein n=1 Tax=Solanum pinnatisectum TaxID=50273 RepID=A0AAV9K9R1_9SOLN|nr:hypothetical protein R3W88_004146 [Solanum pinnatisectum]